MCMHLFICMYANAEFEDHLRLLRWKCSATGFRNYTAATENGMLTRSSEEQCDSSDNDDGVRVCARGTDVPELVRLSETLYCPPRTG